MRKQEFYRKKYKIINPTWIDSLEVYRQLVRNNITPSTYILDIGCGHGEVLAEIMKNTPHTYGVDPDAHALKKNTVIQNKYVGVVEQLPFADDFFDIIVLEWVLEHLPSPHQAFSEIYRVLKPNGRVIFITPNVWNYNVWMIRAIPNRFHSFFTKKLYDREEGDTYPVQYRINSVRAIHKILSKAGFTSGEIKLNGDPSYISFNNFLFYFAITLEKIHDLKIFNRARVHLIGEFRK
jgi:SAM-dependent methyltransferase